MYCKTEDGSGNRPTMKNQGKPNDISIREQLERSILHGLALEWDEAVGYADRYQQALLEKPMFGLRDMKSRLGYWSPRRKEICLSRKLVMNHPWYAVLDVFHHEIAHQFAHQVFGAYEETAHGPSFQKACRILRANPEASGTYPPLDEKLRNHKESSQDRMLVKVKKLMALAQSKNTHEAEAAMAKAHELIAKYNVDVIEKNEQRDFVSVFVGKPALRHTRDVAYLGGLLASFYFVKSIWIPSYVVEKAKMGRVLEITGSAQNVKIAAYVFDVAQNYIDSQWEKYNQDKKLTLHRKTDYAVGIIRGFREKLESQRTGKDRFSASGEKVRALAKYEDPQLEAYFSHRYPRVTSSSRRRVNQDFGIFNDGRASGKKLVISQGIEEKGESGKFLPG